MLCRDTLSIFLLVAKIFISSSFKPIIISPLMMPIVAATEQHQAEDGGADS